jgi:hypothetical protein
LELAGGGLRRTRSEFCLLGREVRVVQAQAGNMVPLDPTLTEI